MNKTKIQKTHSIRYKGEISKKNTEKHRVTEKINWNNSRREQTKQKYAEGTN